MGHQGHLKQEYRDLVQRLEAGPVGLPKPKTEPAELGWREILEILYSPEEAALAAQLPTRPASLKRIATRLKMKPEVLEPRLEAMADKGLVMDLLHPETKKRRYLLAPPVVGFFEFSLMRAQDTIPKARMARALDAYTHGDDTFAQEVFGYETLLGRTLVHETLLSDQELPDVLPWERATALIEEARSLAVALCYCRHKAEHLGNRCDVELDNCMSLNAGADFIIRRGFGRRVERAEALDLLQASREAGLVQIADNVQRRPSYICNCCGCCCGQLQAINDFDLRAVNPSPFIPEPRAERCNGCSRCARACPIGAISMEPQRSEGRRKTGLAPEINSERCIGCGVCASACRRDALPMQARASRPQVPQNSIERVIRQSMERGRLAHLLFDAGDSLGSRFLNQSLQIISGLPGVERLLAQEQLRSRFIRYVLKG